MIKFSLGLLLITCYWSARSASCITNAIDAFEILDREEDLPYKRNEKLGMGAYGTVYRSEGPMGTVAIKVQSSRGTTQVGDSRLEQSDLELELQVMSFSCHPSVAPILDAYAYSEGREDWYVFVMPLYTGGSLFSRFKDQAIEETYRATNFEDSLYVCNIQIQPPEAEVARIMLHLVSALEYMHNTLGFLHGDIKPDNIMWASPASDSLPVIVDFDIMLPIIKDLWYERKLGTPMFMAAEYHHGGPSGNGGYRDGAVDMWALGCILHMLLYGDHPLNLPAFARPSARPSYKSTQGWAPPSDLAREFLSGLLEKNPQERMTALEALGHPWITASN